MENTRLRNDASFPVHGNTIDLSNELEKQLNQQIATETPMFDISQTEDPSAGEAAWEEKVRRTAPEKPDKTVSLINESKFLRYIADLRKADSELALAKAESAELVHQIDSFREHYTEYEQKVSGLIVEQDDVLRKRLDALTALAQSIQDSSSSLSTRIDGEIRRMTQALETSLQDSVKQSCDQELARVKEATDVLLDYSEKVKSQGIRFQRLEQFKFALFVISSIASPIVLILYLLDLAHVF